MMVFALALLMGCISSGSLKRYVLCSSWARQCVLAQFSLILLSLRKWVSEKWVDIGAPKKNGKYQPCGRSKGSKRKYPKCVPLAKASSMSASQKASAVRRKRAAGNTGPKPTNVKTIVRKK